MDFETKHFFISVLWTYTAITHISGDDSTGIRLQSRWPWRWLASWVNSLHLMMVWFKGRSNNSHMTQWCSLRSVESLQYSHTVTMLSETGFFCPFTFLSCSPQTWILVMKGHSQTWPCLTYFSHTLLSLHILCILLCCTVWGLFKKKRKTIKKWK